VRRVRREDAVTHSDDVAERTERRIGRPSKAAPFSSKVVAWLKQDPDLPTQELLRRAKEAGYAGSKTAFYGLVAGIRPPPRAAHVVRFEGLPGEFSQHDFGQVDVTFVDGKKKRVHFFASRLKYSRFAAVTLVDDERVETLVRGVARDFVAFGGLPLMAVFDRPRTIVRKGGRGREVEAFNATFAQAMVDLGVGVEMCAPRSGNQKGSVERLVGWVKSSFFKPRKFLDDTDLRAQLAAWLVEANTKTPSRATGVIPETRRQEELARLRPVKVLPEKLALRMPIFVGPTAEVMFEGVAYSMPPRATHVAGTLFLYEHQLHIVAGRFEATHPRRKKGQPTAPLPEHRAAKIAAVHGDRAKLYEKRQQILNLGGAALALITDIVHREPRLLKRRVERLYVSVIPLFEELVSEISEGRAASSAGDVTAGGETSTPSTARSRTLAAGYRNGTMGGVLGGSVEEGWLRRSAAFLVLLARAAGARIVATDLGRGAEGRRGGVGDDASTDRLHLGVATREPGGVCGMASRESGPHLLELFAGAGFRFESDHAGALEHDATEVRAARRPDGSDLEGDSAAEAPQSDAVKVDDFVKTLAEGIEIEAARAERFVVGDGVAGLPPVHDNRRRLGGAHRRLWIGLALGAVPEPTDPVEDLAVQPLDDGAHVRVGGEVERRVALRREGFHGVDVDVKRLDALELRGDLDVLGSRVPGLLDELGSLEERVTAEPRRDEESRSTGTVGDRARLRPDPGGLLAWQREEALF